MAGDIRIDEGLVDLFKRVASEFTPKAWKNVEAKISVLEVGLHFLCDGKPGNFLRVLVCDSQGQETAYLEGLNSSEAAVQIGSNRRGFDDLAIVLMFQMARSAREFNRTEDLSFKRLFERHRNGLIRYLGQSSARARAWVDGLRQDFESSVEQPDRGGAERSLAGLLALARKNAESAVVDEVGTRIVERWAVSGPDAFNEDVDGLFEILEKAQPPTVAQVERVTVGDYAVSIPEARMSEAGYCLLPHGAVYSIELYSESEVATDADVFIDDKAVGCFRIPSQSSVSLEHPVNDQGRFTFYLLESPEGRSVGLRACPSLGLIQVVFRPEHRIVHEARLIASDFARRRSLPEAEMVRIAVDVATYHCPADGSLRLAVEESLQVWWRDFRRKELLDDVVVSWRSWPWSRSKLRDISSRFIDAYTGDEEDLEAELLEHLTTAREKEFERSQLGADDIEYEFGEYGEILRAAEMEPLDADHEGTILRAGEMSLPAPGGTGLSGRSEQVYGEATDILVHDEDEIVVISLRLGGIREADGVTRTDLPVARRLNPVPPPLT